MVDTEKEVQNLPLPTDPPEPDDEGYANQLAVGFAIGLPIGVAFGLTVFDNIGIGIALGLALGPVFVLIMSQVVKRMPKE